MTNADFQAMIAEFGDRICYVALNNNKRIYFGYPSTPPNNKSEQNCVVNVGDLQFKTFGASDFFGIPRKDYSFPNARVPFIPFISWVKTEFIEQVVVVNEEYVDYRISPYVLG